MAHQIYEAIADGILGGGVYALMAAGLTLIFGVLDIINVAQGILVVVGGYLSYVLSVHLHIDLFLGLLITIPAMFVLGPGHPHHGHPAPARRPSAPRCRCWPASRWRSSWKARCTGSSAPTTSRSKPPTSMQASRWPGSTSVTSTCTASSSRCVLVAAIYGLLYRTRFGRGVRATMQDPIAARLIGIDINRVAALTFGIGVAVTAAGGMAYGATSGGFNPNSGYDLISRLLAIIILGGLGSIGGALAAAVFMITVESLVDIWSPNWAIVVFYAALVIVLTVRPAGLFGRRAVRAQ